MMYNDVVKVRIPDNQMYSNHEYVDEDIEEVEPDVLDETENDAIQVTHQETNQETILKYVSAIKKDSRRYRTDAINKLLDKLENELAILCQKKYTNEEIVKILNRALKDEKFREKYHVPDFIHRLTEERIRPKLRDIRRRLRDAERSHR